MLIAAALLSLAALEPIALEPIDLEPSPPSTGDRVLASSAAALGAAGGHVLGVTMALGTFASAATIGAPELLALAPILFVPPAASGIGAAVAALPFSNGWGALAAGAGALVVGGVATGVTSGIFLAVLSTADDNGGPPPWAVDAAIATLVVVPAAAGALAAAAAVPWFARAPDEDVWP